MMLSREYDGVDYINTQRSRLPSGGEEGALHEESAVT